MGSPKFYDTGPTKGARRADMAVFTDEMRRLAKGLIRASTGFQVSVELVGPGGVGMNAAEIALGCVASSIAFVHVVMTNR